MSYNIPKGEFKQQPPSHTEAVLSESRKGLYIKNVTIFSWHLALPLLHPYIYIITRHNFWNEVLIPPTRTGGWLDVRTRIRNVATPYDNGCRQNYKIKSFKVYFGSVLSMVAGCCMRHGQPESAAKQSSSNGRFHRLHFDLFRRRYRQYRNCHEYLVVIFLGRQKDSKWKRRAVAII